VCIYYNIYTTNKLNQKKYFINVYSDLLYSLKIIKLVLTEYVYKKNFLIAIKEKNIIIIGYYIHMYCIIFIKYISKRENKINIYKKKKKQ